MKRFCGILFVLSVVLALISCGGGGGGGGGTAPATTETSNTASTPATTTTTTTTTTSTTTPTPTYFGTKSPTDPKAVNDIVFSDGSATPYTSGLTLTDAQKNAAVAMIFYKGTECSNDDSIRTLGVGLNYQASGNRWCRNTNDSDFANGRDINITTIQCTPSGSPDSYTFTGDKDGSDNLAQIATFLASNSSTDDTGTAANYPAFYYAKNYGTINGCTGAYANGWYLPTIAELYQIYNLRANIDAAVALCGLNDTFSRTNFWSSSQSQSTYDYNYTYIYPYAYILNFTNGNCGDGFKGYYDRHQVCAVRAF